MLLQSIRNFVENKRVNFVKYVFLKIKNMKKSDINQNKANVNKNIL